MKRIVLLATLIFSACQSTTTIFPAQKAKFTTLNQTKAIANPGVSSELLISSEGIGQAKLGMSLGQLKEISAKDTSFKNIPTFLANFDAIAVTRKGIVQYYILYFSDEDTESDQATSQDDLVITALMTNNNNYQTEQGVKVGTPIKEAEDIYGNAILAYNTEGESTDGEYVTFGSQNPDNIRFKASYFKLISEGLGFSGIYPEYPGTTYTTDKYQEDAAIAGIEVSCNPDDCIN
jgi:hypothetical protein